MDPDTDRWVRSDEARAKLRDLLDEIAADGAHIYVLRYDKPAAVLVPVEWYERVKAAARNGEPVWTEIRNDARTGAYWQDWYCEVPPESAAYTVIRAEWAGSREGHPVRNIYEVRLAP